MSDSELFVVRAYSQAHEAHLACSALQAAGIHATLIDEHIVNANWLYSNAVGGVKLLVRTEDAAAAEAVLGAAAEVDASASAEGGATEPAGDDACPRCGSAGIGPTVFGRRAAVLSWLVAGFPFVPVLRRWRCRACGYRFKG